jgi:hypothetical protein
MEDICSSTVLDDHGQVSATNVQSRALGGSSAAESQSWQTSQHDVVVVYPGTFQADVLTTDNAW